MRQKRTLVKQQIQRNVVEYAAFSLASAKPRHCTQQMHAWCVTSPEGSGFKRSTPALGQSCKLLLAGAHFCLLLLESSLSGPSLLYAQETVRHMHV